MKRTVLHLWLALFALSGVASFGAVSARAEGMSEGLGSVLDIRFGAMTVSREDFFCLALNDYWEARGEALSGRIAVAMVVLNRTMDRRYPASICDVVRQNISDEAGKCQFSWVCDGRPDKPLEWRAWQKSLKLASAVLSRESTLTDPTGGALWYHATFVHPVWARSLTPVARIGDHVFYSDVSRTDLAKRAHDPDARLPRAGRFTGWQEARIAAGKATRVATGGRGSAQVGTGTGGQ